MGLRFRPRRALLRLAAAAATAGIGAHPGQRRAERDAYSQRATAASDAAAPRPQAASASAPPGHDMMDELERLSRLHESGALTHQEFTAAKAHALGLDETSMARRRS